MTRSLYRVTVAPVREWQRQVRERLLPAYASVISQITRDAEEDEIAAAMTAVEMALEGTLASSRLELDQWMRTALRWHERKWAEKVRSGVGVDVYPFIDRTKSLARINSIQEAAASLIRDISEQARKDVSGIIWRGITEQRNRRDVAKDIQERLGIARKRANLIANDQSQKLNSALSDIRAEEAGLDTYIWRHSGKKNYREHHKARDGKRYKRGEPAGDQPGWAIYCGCHQQWVVEVEEAQELEAA